MIKIKGIIGDEVIGTEFADMMARLSGDVDIEIDSPGGYITDGLSIFNAIKRYSRGKVNIKVVGQASSMAAYVMLAGSKLSFMPNAVVCLHNPWNFAVGDYRVMSKNAALLEKLAALYAEQYVEKGIFTEKEIRSIMDEETWFIGRKELAKLGEVETFDGDDTDEPKEPDLSKDRDIVIAQATAKIAQCKVKMREKEFKADMLEKAAALISAQPLAAVNKNELENITIQQEQGEKTMKKDELKAQYPAIYAEVFNEGREAGKAVEKERVTALLAFVDDSKDTIIAAINDGTEITNATIQAKLLKARLGSQAIQDMQANNPDPVDPKQPEHAPENEQEKQSDDDAQKKADEEQARVDKIVSLMGINE